MKSNVYMFLLGTMCLLLLSCGEEKLPKPRAMLRLNYPAPVYEDLDMDCSYTVKKNKMVQIKNAKYTRPCWYNMYYPDLKATVYLSHYEIKNNLDSLLRDAQNLTMEHHIKADGIKNKEHINEEEKVYGTLYIVSGNAASPYQFYVTDSIKHFVSGSVYFDARPNYDSILPAANYLQNDLMHFMETIQWKN
ncbi:gliding motility lipoprotein GldD [Aquimarina addita]|uniref:Gliding motility lipoprotein GldD n=1 Tax=Aquimarina addita TaxID=870485 RepID=A0ABP7XH08_9FLAO